MSFPYALKLMCFDQSNSLPRILVHQMPSCATTRRNRPPKICGDSFLTLGPHSESSVRKVLLDNGSHAWAIGSSQYVKAAIANVEQTLSQRQCKLPSRVDAPLSSGYQPEVDVKPELTPNDASLFQSLIGTLRWIVELGRVDICCEVSMLSSHLALPHEGHLDQLFHIFAYLKKYHNAKMVLDPSDP